MQLWSQDSIFYHIYPLGLCGALHRNDFTSAPQPRLQQLFDWLPHLEVLGINALYLGPVFESTFHGYDTADYYRVDRRLGDNTLLAEFSAACHTRGIRLVLDGVFNHVGREFWAFQDIQQHGENSDYGDWFRGLTFDGRSPFDDPFTYEGWNGHYDLVKLNLHQPEVRAHLFDAISMWVREFGIDGLRLDAADCLDIDFLKALRVHCKNLREDFWLLGEVIHGDYRQWANDEMLDSVTNYECYKGLYSSHVDSNYFEIAYSLKRQFGPQGIYRDLPLYNFADNHDVNRVASSLTEPAHLNPLYILLMTMPGIPSIYYGSEWGLAGLRTESDDSLLRPQLDLAAVRQSAPHPDLAATLSRLARIRRNSPALKYGNYQELWVAQQQLAFARQTADENILVLLNASDQPANLDLTWPVQAARLSDLLNQGKTFPVSGALIDPITVPAHWARILKVS
ncbi:MAG: alpha-glucosidase C-terminal domain-containing protein [Anaerolineales bacterium]|nr:alpha-glucosidase C-terminal domain-containing protein [Anaerolineales bacterium]